MKEIIVTTTDLKQDYDIIGPVYFQVSNKGIFSSALSKLVKKYKEELQGLKKSQQMSEEKLDWGFLYGEYSLGMENKLEPAFYVSIKEIQKRAQMMKADAVICMRQDVDIDSNNIHFFYLQMYGTAVRLK